MKFSVKLTALACLWAMALPGCKRENITSPGNQAMHFLPADLPAASALNTVVTGLQHQLAVKDFSANFAAWHGLPLWDKALQLKKDEANALILVPVAKAGNIEAFIAARVKNGAVLYELHRRSAVEANVQEPSGMNINAVFSRGMLAYFNNSIYNKTDQVPDAVYYTLQQASAKSSPSAARLVTVTFCYNVGYCTDCPDEPAVCCYTKKVCTTVTYDDGSGIIIGGGTGGGGGGGTGGGPGDGGCLPAQSSWYSENPVPEPCDDNNCDANFDRLINATSAESVLLSDQMISQTAERRTRLYDWMCLKNPFGWYLVSREKGVHIRTNDSDPLKQWQWESIEHISLERRGTVFGGDVEPSCTAQPTVGLYNAIMDLNITVKYSAVCKGFPLSRSKSYSTHMRFDMTSAPVPGY